MSVPLHWNAEGLPIGVMFMAPFAREDVLFTLAAQLEEAQPWANRRPPCAPDRRLLACSSSYHEGKARIAQAQRRRWSRSLGPKNPSRSGDNGRLKSPLGPDLIQVPTLLGVALDLQVIGLLELPDALVSDRQVVLVACLCGLQRWPTTSAKACHSSHI